MPTAEWAHENFKLPAESGHEQNYDLDHAPYLYGIFAALDDPDIREVYLMKASQIGWTYGLIVWLCKFIDVDPCTIIVMFAKEEAATNFNDEKLEPSILATPVLRKKLDAGKSKKKTNRSKFKKFAGGFLKLVTSRSISSVKSTTARIVVVEEPDDAPDNLSGQGDAITSLWERTKRVLNYKRVLGGTPTIKDFSHVEAYIKKSDQRVLPIKCHDCGEKHVLDWKNVSWLEDSVVSHEIYGRAVPESTLYVCPTCGSGWSDWQRKQNILATVKEAIALGDPLKGWEATAPFHGAAGFKDLSELYSRLPGAGLADMVKDYLEAEFYAERGNENKRIVFVNNKLARCYEVQADTADEETLEARALEYEELTVPVGGLVLTAGVDIQHDRVAVRIRAWGRGMESWLVYWGELSGNPMLPGDPVYKDLDSLLFQEFKSHAGFKLRMSKVSLDVSDGTTIGGTYPYCRARRKVGVLAAKGDSHDTGSREIFTLPKKIDPKKNNTKAAKYGLKIYSVGTYKAKDLIFSRLKLEGRGEGRMHFYKGVRSDCYEQTLSEVKIPDVKKHKKVYRKKAGVRNEGLDCESLAMHAAHAAKVDRMTARDWDALERKLKQEDLFSEPAPKLEEVKSDDTEQEEPKQKEPPQPQQKKPNFLNQQIKARQKLLARRNKN